MVTLPFPVLHGADSDQQFLGSMSGNSEILQAEVDLHGFYLPRHVSSQYDIRHEGRNAAFLLNMAWLLKESVKIIKNK